MSLTFGLNKSTPENSLNFKPTGNIYFPQPKKAGDYRFIQDNSPQDKQVFPWPYFYCNNSYDYLMS